MSKLSDRILRVERQLEDKDKIADMHQKIWNLERKVNVLAKHLHLKFSDGISVQSTRNKEGES